VVYKSFCSSPIDTSAHNIDFIIDRTVLPEVSKAMLAKMAEEQIPAKLTLGMDEAGNFIYAFT
jgi:type VI secretion system protein VasG